MILQCAICHEIITSRPITGEPVPIIGQTAAESIEQATRSLYPALALHVQTYHAEQVQDTMSAADRFVFLLLLTFCKQSTDRDQLAAPLVEIVEQATLAIIGPVAAASRALDKEADAGPLIHNGKAR